VNTLILVFTSLGEEVVKKELLTISESFPTSIILGASTSGEIYADRVYDDTIVVSITKFELTHLQNHVCKFISPENSYDAGIEMANDLSGTDLQGIFLLSDGLKTNGTKLTQGLASVFGSTVSISGGLSGDKDKFENTWIIEDGIICKSSVCAIGFYGKKVHFKTASQGGWDTLGLTRIVTKSESNVLFELDGKPALDVYKRYLGDKAKELPSSALLFPLELHTEGNEKESKVRTVLGISEEEKSITFAGDIPQNSHVTFMKANFTRLINGAGESAEKLDFTQYKNEELLCIAISCVGRKLVLKSRVDEEIEAIKEVMPRSAKIIGFYSYGEISPLASGRCDLHNQTMTLTAIWESDA